MIFWLSRKKSPGPNVLYCLWQCWWEGSCIHSHLHIINIMTPQACQVSLNRMAWNIKKCVCLPQKQSLRSDIIRVFVFMICNKTRAIPGILIDVTSWQHLLIIAKNRICTTLSADYIMYCRKKSLSNSRLIKPGFFVIVFVPINLCRLNDGSPGLCKSPG
jgi:hypothetical protein